jgi:hypothetical protein
VIAKMTFDTDLLQQQIPYYLTADPAHKLLLTEIKSLSEGADKGYFIPKKNDAYATEMLQGDGWAGFQVLSFTSGDRKMIRGIVLSNSCDVSPENERVLPLRVTFAPIMKLNNLRTRFMERGIRSEQIDQRLQAIRSQSVTNMFYLPADGPLDEEYVALLEDLHSMPIAAHQLAAGKLFTLSMVGFYLFVFKLSVHFCRLHENVDRSSQNATA